MKNISERRKEELIEELEGLQDELGDLVNQLAHICHEIGDNHAYRYLIAGLEIVVEQGAWITQDFTLPQWIDQLKNDDEETWY